MSQDVNITWDSFFYHGQQDVKTENRNDLWIGLLQPARSFLYNRQDSAGIRENIPSGFASFILLRYNIVKWASYRNTYVSNGSDNLPDRRIALSQDSIGVEFPNAESYSGQVNLSVLYINFFDYETPETINALLGA
jgi:hypothetical protein